jgi:hypothetical protein
MIRAWRTSQRYTHAPASDVVIGLTTGSLFVLHIEAATIETALNKKWSS